jgi:hypothetical protein
MKVYNNNEITPNDFIQLHIQNNVPCVIKNFLSDQQCSATSFLKYITNNKLESYKIGNITSHSIKISDFCNNNKFIKAIQNDPNIIVENEWRIWKHNKNNFTKWHYDGNGSDLLNISVSGSKRFYLAPPNSFPVYPLSNIGLDINFKEHIVYDLMPTDMLFIPAYWFHQVLTLEDDTVNVNFTMFNKKNHIVANPRDSELFMVHKFFNTNMCDFPICDIVKNKIPMHKGFTRAIFEMLPIYLIILLVFIFLKKKIYKQIFLYGLIIGCFYLLLNKKFVYDTFGISYLYGVFIFIFAYPLLLLTYKY